MQVSDAVASATEATELPPQSAARLEAQQHLLRALLEAMPPDQAPTTGVLLLRFSVHVFNTF